MRTYLPAAIRAITGFVSLLGASAASSFAPPAATPLAERVTANTYRVGNVLVDVRSRTVSCPGAINMDAGTIEYLAVAPHGKLHESLIRLDVRPIHLQLALLALDLEPRNVLQYQGDRRRPEGPGVDIRIRWRDAEGAQHEVPAADMVGSTRPGSGPCSWVFTGSRIVPQGFEADLQQSLIAVWHDPAAIVDNRSAAGAWNTCVVRSGSVPKRGTTVEMVIHPVDPLPASRERSE